jgi:uncharacterized iron-regulated protein
MPQPPLPSKNRSWIRPRAVVAACVSSAIALLGTGCSPKAGGYYLTRAQAHEPSDAIVPANPGPPRSFAMFEGDTGRVAAWHDLIEGVAWAEIVLVGEVHDHRAAHLFQQALAEDMLASFPGTAVALEMLERDEQELVDRYLRGELPLETFIAETESANWAGKPKEGTPPGQGTWEDFYQPLIDAAKRSNARVIAANAPRDYVRRARLEGYDALRALPAEERALFDLPVKLEDGDYFERFVDVMSSSEEERADPEARARIRRTFQSQQVWDATMAASVVRALDDPDPSRRATKVVLAIGGFHVDHRLGTATQIMLMRPRTRVLVVQVVPEASRVLRDEDRGRGDIVVYAER